MTSTRQSAISLTHLRKESKARERPGQAVVVSAPARARSLNDEERNEAEPNLATCPLLNPARPSPQSAAAARRLVKDAKALAFGRLVL